jgi:predicted metal-dependent peptidase
VQHGIYLPGVVREGMELVVCVDTSGSVDRETLSEFYAEIKGILASYENTHAHVIVCDADVTTDVQDIDEFSVDRIQFKGGGGTSFVPSLEKAQEFNPKVCIYLTDGCGTFPEAPSFPVIWALGGQHVPADEVPFGIAVIMS